jgi:hypothetical protein
MSIEAFTNFGIFVALFIGYLLITGLIGCIQRGMKIDGDKFLIQAWLSGAVLFAFIVTDLWRLGR